MIGKTISHYKIFDKLGEGGMGVVYKAQDTKLDRTVAIKFLSKNIGANVDELKRFEIEAKAAAALNHPNITTIHAIEEHNDEMFIVMEYIEGRELRDMVGFQNVEPLPIGKIIDYATQIASGLRAAHKKGITHRDIKSSNIMITAEGQIKIMDFGLAKVAGVAQLTKDQSTLGTAAYMSPEQATGGKVDHRSDIWSLGVVLYEMLTGQLPFRGEYEQVMIYSIVNEEPEPISSAGTEMPESLQQIVSKCLEKERENRYGSTGYLLTDLKQFKKELDSGGSVTTAAEFSRNAKTRKRPLASVLAAAALVLALGFVIISLKFFEKKAPVPRIVQTRQLTATLTIVESAPALSPEGSRIAYGSDETGNFDIWVQQIASGRRINLTEDHQGSDFFPQWSPDGEWIAFVSNRDGGGIFMVSEYGGRARQVLAHARADIGPFSLSPDGKRLAYILNSSRREKAFTVTISGGAPTEIPLPEPCHDGPTWSPDGKRLVYASPQRIWTLRLDGSDPVPVLDASSLSPPIWLSGDKGIFFKQKTSGENPEVWWIPVNEDGSAAGSARPLTVGARAYHFSLTHDGKRLAYSGGVGYVENLWRLPTDTIGTLSMADAEQITFEEQTMRGLAISPDHEWFAFSSNRGGASDIWMVNKSGNDFRQVTADSATDRWPSWSPDGERIAFTRSSAPFSPADIYVISVNGSLPTPLAPHPAGDGGSSWSLDGQEIVFVSNRSGNFDLWVVPADDGEPKQLTTHEAIDGWPQYSPDGKWISFLSDRTGAFEIYLLSTSSGELRQLAHLGLVEPFRGLTYTWSPDGKIIYLNYDPEPNDESRTLAAINVSDGSVNKILESPDVRYLLPSDGGLAADGDGLHFVVNILSADIWLADLVYE